MTGNEQILWQQGEKWRLVQRGDRAIVRHPGAVVIVPLLADGRVLMLSQYRYALDDTIVELPAGTRGWDEAWEPCARRELREETGYRGRRWDDLGTIWPLPGYSDELMRLYLARDLSYAPLPPDDDEQIEVRPMPFEAALRMALDGRLRDAKSVVGLLRAAVFLGRTLV